MREKLAVADLIPDDILIPEGWVVNGYPHGIGDMPGTLVPFDMDGINYRKYYSDRETIVTVLRD
jgi:hypothetical protein